jgi:acyl-CoA reductase-like NAD-dependent aldehyde dehydrogenase
VNKTLGKLKTRFVKGAFELGGCDAAYVRADVVSGGALKQVAAQIVDGAMYNAGQSCCGVQRVYVHADVHDEFVQHAARALSDRYVMGDPMDTKTSLGPVAQIRNLKEIREVVESAVAQGASKTVSSQPVPELGRFYPPTMLVGCDHTMKVMREECFGPVMAVCRVESDGMAVRLVNDCRYGLTASVFTSSAEHAESIAKALNVGTVLMNRCDFLDAYLPFSGRKDSGNGHLAMSALGFQAFTHTKALHFKLGGGRIE